MLPLHYRSHQRNPIVWFVAGVPYDTFLSIMEYIYTGDVHIAEHMAVDLVKAGMMPYTLSAIRVILTV